MTYGQPDPLPPMDPTQHLHSEVVDGCYRCELGKDEVAYIESHPQDELQFGGVAEIAAMLGVPRSTVSMWDSRRGTNGYPEPVARLTMGPVYDLEAVRLWHTSKGQQS